jgi:hypothetical protein
MRATPISLLLPSLPLRPLNSNAQNPVVHAIATVVV